MAQQTAMKYVLSLVEQMFNNADALKLELPASLLNDIINIITQEGIQMEKEQIITAASIGILWGENEEQLQSSVKFGEEYYDRTFTLTPQGENPSAKETEQF
jgi:hypothetical protein